MTVSCPACGSPVPSGRPYRNGPATGPAPFRPQQLRLTDGSPVLICANDGTACAYGNDASCVGSCAPVPTHGSLTRTWYSDEASTRCSHRTYAAAALADGRQVPPVRCTAHVDCGCCSHVLCSSCGTHSDEDSETCEDCGSVVGCCCDCFRCSSCGSVTDYGCGTCELGDCCCSCDHCGSCGDAFSEWSGEVCSSCGYCGSCGCECEDEDECGCSSCSGDGMGTSRETPWSARGVQVDYASHKAQHPTHEDCFPVDTSLDPAQSMCDFYLLEAMASSVLTRCGSPHPLQDCPTSRLCTLHAAAARTDLERLVRTLDDAFTNYAAAAIGGELRHHQAVGGEDGSYPTGTYSSSSRTSGWRDFHAVMLQVGPAAALRDAAALSREVNGGTYLGERWAVPADLLAMRHDGTLPPHLWVDRVFTLQHNGGSFLDKYGWHQAGPYSLRDMMRKVGPAHDSSDFPVLTRGATADVAHAAALCLDPPSPVASSGAVLPCARLRHHPVTGRLARVRRDGTLRTLEGD